MPDFKQDRDDFPRKSGGEFQDSGYHDEEPEIVADDLPRPVHTQPMRKRPPLRPQPRRRYYED